jgi:hypothetical protein
VFSLPNFRWTRLLPAVLLVVISQTAAADKLQAAIDFLAAAGIPTPTGYTVQWGETGGAPGSTNPDTGEININADGIRAISPNLEGEPADFGGILVVVLYHEYKHAGGSFANTSPAGRACDEVQLVHQVAAKNCEFIEFICQEISGANVKPICTFYSDVQDNYNNGSDGAGGASAAHAKHGCSGSYQGDIPDCAACDPDGSCSGD